MKDSAMTLPLSLLQTACFRADVSPAQLMRAAVVVASAIQDATAVESFRRELGGYDTAQGDPPDLPAFRQAHGRLMATDRWARSQPAYIDDAAMMDRLSTVPVTQGLPALEAFTRGNSGGAYEVGFSPEAHQKLLEAFSGATKVYRVVQQAQFLIILEQARQMVFDWCLDKAREGVSCPDHVDLRGLLPPVQGEPERVEPLIARAGVTVSASNSSVIIHSPSSTSSVHQHNEVDTAALRSVVGMLEALIQSYAGKPTDQQVQALAAQVQELKDLASLEKPRAAWVRDSLQTVRGILENAAGSLLATAALRPEVIAAVQRLLA